MDKQTAAAMSGCKREYGYSTQKICELDKIIRQNVIKEICLESTSCIPEHIHIELIEKILAKGGSVDLFGDFRAVAKQEYSELKRPKIITLMKNYCFQI